jgi:hypothetical protein
MTTALAFPDDDFPTDETSLQAMPEARTRRLSPAVDQPADGQATDDTHGPAAVGSIFPADHDHREAQSPRVGGDQPASGQVADETHVAVAAGSNFPADQTRTDAQMISVGGEQTEDGSAATIQQSPPDVASSLADPFLALAADVLDDTERTRIANENRLRQLTRSAIDADGEERGFGLDEAHPDVARLAAIVQTLAKVEHDATLNLQRQMRRHPLGAWVKTQIGIGEKQAARLLATIGDPYWNTLYDRPRTVSELWAFCGLHVLPVGHKAIVTQGADAGGDSSSAGGDPSHPGSDAQTPTTGVAARRRKGQRANWSTTAKTRAYLIATSCIKQARSPYRATYDKRRAHTATTHPDWTAGHSHNDAMRVTSKAILRDLWIEARRIHEGAETSA